MLASRWQLLNAGPFMNVLKNLHAIFCGPAVVPLALDKYTWTYDKLAGQSADSSDERLLWFRASVSRRGQILAENPHVLDKRAALDDTLCTIIIAVILHRSTLDPAALPVQRGDNITDLIL